MPDTDEMPSGEQTESTIMTLLLDPVAQYLWAVEELAREIGRPTQVADALTDLAAAGLIHQIGDFVFASRAAIRQDQLAM